jgi:hypothetical protein
LPKPLPQGAEPDEHAIGGQQEMRVAAILRALPREFQRVDENEARRRACADLYGH